MESEEKIEQNCHFDGRSLTIGAGAPYSFHFQIEGVILRRHDNVGEKFCFSPEFVHFKNANHEIADFDFIGYYIFETQWVGIYPLADANYTSEKEFHGDEEVHTSFGTFFAAGVHRNLKTYTLFMEYSRAELRNQDQPITGALVSNFH